MTAITLPTRSTIDTQPRALWRVAGMATLAGAAATELFGLAARAAGIPMKAADPGAAAAKAIPVGGLFMAVVMNAALGLVVAGLLLRYAKNPARTFAVAAIGYALLSELAPLFAAHTTAATKLVLLAAHLIAAAIIVPPVTARLRAHRTHSGS